MKSSRQQIVPSTGTVGELSLVDLGKQIASYHHLCVAAVGDAVDHAVNCGKLLLAAKKQLGHGEWLLWLEKYGKLSVRTAQLYMQAARNPNKCASTIAHLTFDSSPKRLAPDSNEADSAEPWETGLDSETVAKLKSVGAKVREGFAMLQAADADKAAALVKAQKILGPRFEEWAAACLNEAVNPKEFLQ